MFQLDLSSAKGVHRAKNVKAEKTIFRQNLEKYAKIRKFDNLFENCLVMATNDKNTRETFFRYTTTLIKAPLIFGKEKTLAI